MDDPNITMEEYIRLEEEKARKRGKVYNWETAKYGNIWYDEDVHDLRSIETEFPAIFFDDAFTSEVTPSYEPMVSPLNDSKINFRISFDESDDEDYMVVYDKNSLSYKIISINNLKTDFENDNDKVNMLLFPSPEPEVGYFNDLDLFKDFENEYPAIVYNYALTSKSDFLTEPTISPQHIDEFDLENETSLSKCEEEERNVLYFNNLFPFKVIYPDDSKSDTDNDNDKIDIEHSLGIYLSNHYLMIAKAQVARTSSNPYAGPCFHPFWSRHGHSRLAVVEFRKTRDGFDSKMTFVKDFELDKHGRKDFYDRGKGRGMELMQEKTTKQLENIFIEHEKSKRQLEDREKELRAREAVNDTEKRKLGSEKKKCPAFV
ncbi:putative reverse transcriptase domain-containing protein [Tanacetum coccineum]